MKSIQSDNDVSTICCAAEDIRAELQNRMIGKIPVQSGVPLVTVPREMLERAIAVLEGFEPLKIYLHGQILQAAVAPALERKTPCVSSPCEPFQALKSGEHCSVDGCAAQKGRRI